MYRALKSTCIARHNRSREIRIISHHPCYILTPFRSFYRALLECRSKHGTLQSARFTPFQYQLVRYLRGISCGHKIVRKVIKF